ncbi:MAG: glycoside hydrolase family 3 C-terminal domain-containing protein [Nibricoccus sp.]
MIKNIIAIVILFASICSEAQEAKNRWQDASLPVAERVEHLLRAMTLEEKIAMLGGDTTGFNACGVERLSIPMISMADGPVGIRAGISTAYPASINTAATWDLDLVYRLGVALGVDARGKGKDCILGPCVGIHRFPLGGRNFESFGEDPYLAARLGTLYIRGVQSQKVIATVKHFACNDQEWERNSYDVQVDERTLREIHLPAFEAAVKEGKVWAVMTAYNSVNGQHCSENGYLIRDILKAEWGFQGLTISDWVSVYSADQAANNGLDLEMPHPRWFKERLLEAIKSGTVAEVTIDDKIRRHLRVRFEAGLFDRAVAENSGPSDTFGTHRQLALEMAQKSITLLKNDGILPLDKDRVKTIAVLGPNAKVARTGGGGSSQVKPQASVSPYDGLAATLGRKIKLSYAQGCALEPLKTVPIPTAYLKTPDGKNNGLWGEYFDNSHFSGEPVFSRRDEEIDFSFKQLSPDPRITNAEDYAIRWTGKLVPPATRVYTLALASDDGSRLYIDGKLVIDHWGQHAEVQKTCSLSLEGGHSYEIRIDFYQIGGNSGVHFNWQDPEATLVGPTIDEAVEVAKGKDLVLLFVGNSEYSEAEGADVDDQKMPAGQDELVRSVIQANPNTVVVVYGGVPISMKSWLAGAKAVAAAYYPGQEGGMAIAQVLFGEINPSGKLPFSYIQEQSESPAFRDYKNPNLKVRYAEGVFVGYRYYEKHDIRPLFPFGHGLSYTNYKYSNLRIRKGEGKSCVVVLDITNTGRRAGEEIVQLYVAPGYCSVLRPLKELKNFARIHLEPGETKSVSMELDARAFEYFHPVTREWTLEAGNYRILVGASSDDIRLKGSIDM